MFGLKKDATKFSFGLSIDYVGYAPSSFSGPCLVFAWQRGKKHSGESPACSISPSSSSVQVQKQFQHIKCTLARKPPHNKYDTTIAYKHKYLDFAVLEGPSPTPTDRKKFKSVATGRINLADHANSIETQTISVPLSFSGLSKKGKQATLMIKLTAVRIGTLDPEGASETHTTLTDLTAQSEATEHNDDGNESDMGEEDFTPHDPAPIHMDQSPTNSAVGTSGVTKLRKGEDYSSPQVWSSGLQLPNRAKRRDSLPDSTPHQGELPSTPTSTSSRPSSPPTTAIKTAAPATQSSKSGDSKSETPKNNARENLNVEQLVARNQEEKKKREEAERINKELSDAIEVLKKQVERLEEEKRAALLEAQVTIGETRVDQHKLEEQMSTIGDQESVIAALTQQTTERTLLDSTLTFTQPLEALRCAPLLSKALLHWGSLTVANPNQSYFHESLIKLLKLRIQILNIHNTETDPIRFLAYASLCSHLLSTLHQICKIHSIPLDLLNSNVGEPNFSPGSRSPGSPRSESVITPRGPMTFRVVSKSARRLSTRNLSEESMVQDLPYVLSVGNYPFFKEGTVAQIPPVPTRTPSPTPVSSSPVGGLGTLPPPPPPPFMPLPTLYSGAFIDENKVKSFAQDLMEVFCSVVALALSSVLRVVDTAVTFSLFLSDDDGDISAQPKELIRLFASVLNEIKMACGEGPKHSPTTVFVFSQLCAHLNATLFNSLLTGTTATGEQFVSNGVLGLKMKSFISHVGEWLAQKDLKGVKRQFDQADQAADVLLVRKDHLMNTSMRRDVCPLLNLSQLLKILNTYSAQGSAEGTVPPALLTTLQSSSDPLHPLMLDTHIITEPPVNSLASEGPVFVDPSSPGKTSEKGIRHFLMSLPEFCFLF